MKYAVIIALLSASQVFASSICKTFIKEMAQETQKLAEMREVVKTVDIGKMGVETDTVFGSAGFQSSTVLKGTETVENGVEVSGDFVQAHKMADGRVSLLMVDVVNHGVRSAFIAEKMKVVTKASEFLKAIENSKNAASIFPLLDAVRGEYAEKRTDFATLGHFILDPQTGKVDFDCGMIFILVVKPDGTVQKPPKRIGYDKPVGAGFYKMSSSEGEKTSSGEGMFQLEKGDRLVIFSDGLAEGKHNDGQMIGMNGISTLLSETIGKKPNVTPEELNRVLLEHVNNRSDDTTIVTIEWPGPK